ncbi:MAG: hypothetical protein LBD94_02480 [Rickettsiales bacterium]|jgi:uncharacterized membrane protein|nr:hypothetical protein [Rickettsiales bacterium]
MKILKSFAVIGVVILAGMTSAYAAGLGGDPCVLINELGYVFRTLRTLAFAGAAFMIAGWAWTYIKGSSDGKTSLVDDLKNKGVGLLVGFALLFGLGVIIQFLPGFFECGNLNW